MRSFFTPFVFTCVASAFAVIPSHSASGTATASAAGYPDPIHVSHGYGGAIPTQAGSALAEAGFSDGGSAYNLSDAYAASSSSFGTLHAAASAIAMIDPKHSGVGFYTNASSGQGTASAQFIDEITLTSGSLPIGTEVAYTLTLSLHANFLFENASDFGSASAFAMNGSMGLIRTGAVGEASQMVSYRLGKVGDKIAIDGQLTATAFASAAYTYPNSTVHGSASVDASNTSSLTVSITTPGAGYTSLSGASYAPVPEPASICALGLGAAALLRRKKRA